MKPRTTISKLTRFVCRVCIDDASDEHPDFSFHFTFDRSDNSISVTYGRYPGFVIFRPETIRTKCVIDKWKQKTRIIDFSDEREKKFRLRVELSYGRSNLPTGKVTLWEFPPEHPAAFLSRPSYLEGRYQPTEKEIAAYHAYAAQIQPRLLEA